MSRIPDSEGVRHRTDNGDSDLEEKYAQEYEEEADAIRQYGSGNITYSRRIGSYVDLGVPEQASRFFAEFTDGGMSVYVVGVTNNPADYNETTKEAYLRMRLQQKEVMLGQWTSPHGVRYRDAILIMSGINREQALKYKKQYNQLSIVEIRENGSPGFI